MLRKLLNWLQENRRWNKEHRRAWAGVTEPGPDGLSAFQRRTEAMIHKVIAAHGVEIESRELIRTVDDMENYLILKVTDPSMTIWIYRNQVNAKGPTKKLRLEEWDARTPGDHRAQVLDFLESQI